MGLRHVQTVVAASLVSSGPLFFASGGRSADICHRAFVFRVACIQTGVLHRWPLLVVGPVGDKAPGEGDGMRWYHVDRACPARNERQVLFASTSPLTGGNGSGCAAKL